MPKLERRRGGRRPYRSPPPQDTFSIWWPLAISGVSLGAYWWWWRSKVQAQTSTNQAMMKAKERVLAGALLASGEAVDANHAAQWAKEAMGHVQAKRCLMQHIDQLISGLAARERAYKANKDALAKQIDKQVRALCRGLFFA